MEEEILIKQAQAGNLDSFEILIRRHESNIYNLALILTHNEIEAEEVVQQVFVKLWKKLGWGNSSLNHHLIHGLTD